MNETFNKNLWTPMEMTPLTSEKGSLGKWLVTLCMVVRGEQEARLEAFKFLKSLRCAAMKLYSIYI